VFALDEARFGQKGSLTPIWARTGSRPTAVKQTRYEWLYLSAAVEPATGDSVALQTPGINTGTFNVFLRMISEHLGPDEVGVLVMDRAGWHVSKQVRMPDNLLAWLLPPRSPELNPVERVWAWMRSHDLSNRAFDDYDHILDATAQSWRGLTKARLRSLCRCSYLTRKEKV
jgi:transposase